MSPPPVLVSGATGALGFQIAELLTQRGTPVRALVRPGSSPARRDRLRQLGAELTEADLERPATLAAAVAGAAAVVTTASSFPVDPRPDAVELVDRAGSLNLVEAALAAGVGRFVYVSFREIDVDFPFQQAKRAVEAGLAGSGLPFCVLRPGNFMDVWFSPALGFDLAAGSVTVYGEGNAPVSWMAAADVARFAVWALEADEARGATFDLGGPEPMSQLEVVAVYEGLGGRPLERSHLRLPELERRYAQAGSPLERSLAGVMLGAARGGVTDSAQLAARAGIEPSGVRAFAARQLAAAG